MRALINRTRWLTLLSISGLALGACAVGPDFTSPAAPKTKGYTKSPLPTATVNTKDPRKAGKVQQFSDGRDIPAEWWALYHSPTLDALIKQGLANSPDLAAAKAALVQAKESYRAQVGTSYAPAINGNLGGGREQANASSTGSGGPFNLYNASVDVSYTVDAFGGQRRTVEASAAQVDYQKYELAAAYLSLTANIVTTAINAASLQAQINATQALIEAQQRYLTIVQKQFKLGGASQSDVLTQANALAQSRATLPPLQNSLSQTQNALAVLVGALPSETPNINILLDSLDLPTDLPVSLPSKLVEQRPDILASSAQLHVACANVGIATANLLPQITLTGSYGNSSNHTNTLFNGNSVIWGIGGQLVQPIFNGGALRAERRAAIAAYEQAGAQYKQTVLQAFANVGDALQALQLDAINLQAQQQAESTAYQTWVMTQKQYKLGAVNLPSVLTAEQSYQQAKINRIKAEATRYSDTAALFQALGGGWWQQSLDKDPPASTSAQTTRTTS